MATLNRDVVEATSPSRVKRSAAAVLRTYGVVTSPIRRPPDFLIIGAKRAGTTSLFWYLQQHPCVSPIFPSRQRIKGAHFFDVDFHHDAAWYRSHFPSSPYRWCVGHLHDCSAIAGEASPYYLFHPLAAKRASIVVPRAKIIVVLRDPVDRAWSHYRERVRHGAEPLRFEEAVAREPERLAGEFERLALDDGYRSYAHEHWSYVTQGIYVDPLRVWLSLFSREQLHVVISEQLFSSPDAVLADVLRFVGLRPIKLTDHRRHNYHPSDAMAPVIRERLSTLFRPHNERLEELLGMEFGWP